MLTVVGFAGSAAGWAALPPQAAAPAIKPRAAAIAIHFAPVRRIR
jgi:hypothetical protein